MSEIILKSEPAAGGWWVACDLPLEPIYFHSDMLAEQSARNLALTLTDLGRDVRLFVCDVSRQIVATHRYFGLS